MLILNNLDKIIKAKLFNMFKKKIKILHFFHVTFCLFHLLTDPLACGRPMFHVLPIVDLVLKPNFEFQ